MPPVVQAADLVPVEEGFQRPAGGELLMFGLEFLKKSRNPAVRIVVAGVGDEEIELV
jgi:hypothetical protein